MKKTKKVPRAEKKVQMYVIEGGPYISSGTPYTLEQATYLRDGLLDPGDMEIVPHPVP